MRITNIIGLTVSSIIGRVLENIKIKDNVSPNTETTFNNYIDTPFIDASSYIHHYAAIVGSVDIRKNVFIGPFSSIRGDEGLKIYIGNGSNVQDGVVLHGFKNYEYQNLIANNSVFKDNIAYSIYIGNKVSLAPQCQVHGPARIDTNVYVGTH
ncbi:MAG: hypothetical protein ACQEWV_31080 [Bacillota bacterium]